MKFGASYYYLPLHQFNADTLNGSFGFSASDKDFDRNDPRTYPDRLTIRVPVASDFFVKGTEVGVFAQDKWKVNSRLTTSLGLRYDVEIVPIDQTGNYLFADPKTYPIDKNNVSPRMGASYALDQAATAVVRGGWGLYYQKTAYSNFTPIVSSGFISDSFTVNFPTNNIDPGPSQGRLPTDGLRIYSLILEWFRSHPDPKDGSRTIGRESMQLPTQDPNQKLFQQAV